MIWKYLAPTLTAILGSLLLPACQSADTRNRLVVSVPQQRMGLYQEGNLVTTFPVSTSRFGLGDQPRTNFTPLGRLRIAQKIGGGMPWGMKFESRVPTGEIVYPNSPGRDPIVTRILWLQGMEPQNANAYGRYIYIHGTPEEAYLGRPRSYGCVRMASRDIANLYDVVGKGARVDILTYPLPPSGQLPR
jgi:lipoprotein-anchoring transpeptidase ErfK/SrfK